MMNAELDGGIGASAIEEDMFSVTCYLFEVLSNRMLFNDVDDDSGKRSFIINRRIKTTIRKDILW